MARTKATNTASASTNKGAGVEQKTESKNNETKAQAQTQTKVEADTLTDDDEIEVESLVANVSYYDDKTGDRFVWGEIGDVQDVPFGVLKNMYRHFKGYFLNLYIKPNDERVIKHFKLNKVYDKYKEVLDEKNFTGKNINHICETIKKLPDALKFTTFTRIQTWVSGGVITDIKVVRTLEKVFGLELYNLLNLD